jgi:hypothetical protein
MPLADRNKIRVQDASVGIDGRTVAPTMFSYSFDTPQSTEQAIGTRIHGQDGETSITFEMEFKVTQEDLDFHADLLGRETGFDATGRIPRGDGTFKDLLFPNCKLSSRRGSIAIDSTISISGTCEKMRVLS